MPKNLKSILKNADLSLFPYSKDYCRRFTNVEDYLNTHVHPSVVIGASIHDGGLLNDHGVEHVQMVIERASALLKPIKFENQPALTPYEIYLLLCAIHVHDVGNIGGREEHERNNAGIASELRPFVEHDVFEIEVFRSIAEAHGGRHNGSKDKLHRMPERQAVNSMDVRSRALAAILKFSDELADDKTRGNSRLLENGSMPKGSEIYHKYSLSIQSLNIRPDVKSIDLEFFLTIEDITRTWGKQDGTAVVDEYIIDEIYARTKKMHLERVYCSRYMREFVEIDQISVNIGIWKQNTNAPMENVETIKYRLEETGYPDEDRKIEVYTIPGSDSFVSGDSLFKKYQVLGDK